ncbi:hypothetical protein BHS06_16270 [Myxococcus xanthus]|nr:hypothetical protein BHS06_16270 [Myxococcus xanthus]
MHRRPVPLLPSRRSLLPAEFTLRFRRLDAAGERWAAGYCTSTATGEGMAPLLSAFTNALVEVRRVAVAGHDKTK